MRLYFFLPLLVISFMLTPLSSMAQSFLIPFRSGEKWGYANREGELVVAAKYDKVSFENENNRWFVFLDDKMGVIDLSGKEVLLPIFDTIARDPQHSTYHNYYALLDSLEGYYDMEGNTLLEPVYKTVIQAKAYFSFPQNLNNYFLVQKTDTWQIRKGEKVLLDNLDKVYDLSQFIVVIKDDKFGVYDLQNEKIALPINYDSLDVLHSEKGDRLKKAYEEYYFWGISEGQYYLISKDFSLVKAYNKPIDDLFEKVSPQSYAEEDLVEMELESYFDLEYMSIRELCSSNIANCILKNGRYNSDLYQIKLLTDKSKIGLLLSYRSKTIKIEPKWSDIKVSAFPENNKFHNDRYFIVQSGEKFGVLDASKQEIIAPVKYDSIGGSHPETFLELYKGDKVGVLGLENDFYSKLMPTFLIEASYDKLVQMHPVRSTDFNYDSIIIYEFEKNGKTYLVSGDGVSLYKD